MTIPSHLTLTGRPLLLDPKVVPELKARLDAHFAGKDAGPIDRLVGKARKKKAKPAAFAAPLASRRVTLSAPSDTQIQKDPFLEIITLRGPLLDRAVFFGEMLCADGYDRISADLSRAVNDPNCAGILLDIDSPGGMVSGCFELSDEIRAARDIKPVISFCSGVTASAAYAIACASTEIFGRESAMIGSVGVIYPRLDWTKSNEQDGFNVTIFKSGEKKDWGHPDTVMSDAEAAETQALIDKLAGKFFDRVAMGRDKDAADIAALQAGIFDTEDAIGHGLADQIGEMPAAVSRLTELAFAPKEPSPAGDIAPEPADPDPAAGQSTIKETKMSKMIRAGLSGKLRYAAAAMASAHLKAMDEDETSAMDEDELDAATAEEADDEVEAMTDDEVEAMDEEDDASAEYDEDDAEMMDEDDEAAKAKSFRATASRIARKSLARATKAAPAPAAKASASQNDDAAAIAAHGVKTGKTKAACSAIEAGLTLSQAKTMMNGMAKDAASSLPPPQTPQPGPSSTSPAADRSSHLDRAIERRNKARSGA